MKSYIVATIVPVLALANAGGYGNGYATYGAYGGYGAYGEKSAQTTAASMSKAAAKAGYSKDAWADKIYGKDFKSSWGRSYDLVEADSFDDEQYKRELDTDDDAWGSYFSETVSEDKDAAGEAASVEIVTPKVTKTVLEPVVEVKAIKAKEVEVVDKIIDGDDISNIGTFARAGAASAAKYRSDRGWGAADAGYGSGYGAGYGVSSKGYGSSYGAGYGDRDVYQSRAGIGSRAGYGNRAGYGGYGSSVNGYGGSSYGRIGAYGRVGSAGYGGYGDSRVRSVGGYGSRGGYGGYERGYGSGYGSDYDSGYGRSGYGSAYGSGYRSGYGSGYGGSRGYGGYGSRGYAKPTRSYGSRDQW